MPGVRKNKDKKEAKGSRRIKKGNIAHLFGSNPKEADGLKFQKKMRSEWD
jgi:hypothetical protein